MQINRFTKIVIFVTSLGSTFLAALRFLFFTFAFLLFILLYSLECTGGFRLCGGDHGLCPLDSHKPLKRLDRNFKCFGVVNFVWLIGFCAKLRLRRLAIPDLQQT